MRMIKTVLVLFTGVSLTVCPKAEGKLIGYWPLDATSGTIATNLASGGTTGVLVGNGVTWTNDAQRGQVLSFGTGSTATNYVDAGFVPAIAISSNFTWSFWAYSQQAPNNNVILGNRYDATDKTGSQWIKFTPSKFEYTGISGNLDYVDLPQNQWIHHAVVKLGSTFTYYRDGVAYTNVTTTTPTDIRPFYMGGDKFGEWWQGRIDDVAIWTDALPTNAITGLANGTLTPLTAPRYPSTFDLADAIGGGDGRLPGYGGGGSLSATMGTYTTFPANPYVDGTFVPNTNATVAVIDGAGHTYDFDSQNSSSIALMPWFNGLNMDLDPSTNILANFSGDPTNHSLISAHASKGITFDLDGVRAATGLSIARFTACIGDSRPKAGGSISYYVFVDGALVTNRFNVHDSEDFVSVSQVAKGRYLTIAITDANDGSICDHGYLGDAFLTLIPYTPPEPSKGTLIRVQ